MLLKLKSQTLPKYNNLDPSIKVKVYSCIKYIKLTLKQVVLVVSTVFYQVTWLCDCDCDTCNYHMYYCILLLAKSKEENKKTKCQAQFILEGKSL